MFEEKQIRQEASYLGLVSWTLSLTCSFKRRAHWGAKMNWKFLFSLENVKCSQLFHANKVEHASTLSKKFYKQMCYYQPSVILF